MSPDGEVNLNRLQGRVLAVFRLLSAGVSGLVSEAKSAKNSKFQICLTTLQTPFLCIYLGYKK